MKSGGTLKRVEKKKRDQISEQLGVKGGAVFKVVDPKNTNKKKLQELRGLQKKIKDQRRRSI